MGILEEERLGAKINDRYITILQCFANTSDKRYQRNVNLEYSSKFTKPIAIYDYSTNYRSQAFINIVIHAHYNLNL